MKRTIKVLTSIILLMCCQVTVQAQSPEPDSSPRLTINFAINSPGSAPYLYFDPETRQYKGVVVDFFASFADREQLAMRYQDSSRARNELLVKEGKSDMFLAARVWLDNPDSFIYSDKLMSHASFMYATKPFSSPFIPEEHPGATVCTRRGFIYPVLQRYFANEQNGLSRVNSISQTTMAMMLARERCQFAIMNEQNALSILTHSRFCDTDFYQSPNVISEVDLVLVIRPERRDAQELINKYIAEFIHSGQLEASVARHSGDQGFPKLKCQ
ncbi:substrate-binding periplasmic protein [Alteromonas gilva]|uniref:Transporter substrate-binding domain-containing protein n=1 Tax=Alteromonas gilva TaxID=2987522 RepID=A0ABT5KWZ7_9ALTE|nr:transporter substrate-binding domain-containing protein [Alteromonas gilva]MDC8829280.1 transporter substrate-binding domain-containing protein [Alteromonas gilva]